MYQQKKKKNPLGSGPLTEVRVTQLGLKLSKRWVLASEMMESVNPGTNLVPRGPFPTAGLGPVTRASGNEIAPVDEMLRYFSQWWQTRE